MDSQPPLVGAPTLESSSDKKATRPVFRVVAVAVAAGLLGFLFGATTNTDDDSAATETSSPSPPTTAGNDPAPSDVVVTIDREMELRVRQMLADTVAETGASSGVAVIVGAGGKILATVRTDAGQASVTTTTTTRAGDTASSSAPSTSAASAPTTRVEVVPLEGAAALLGDVALTPLPSPAIPSPGLSRAPPGPAFGGTLWVFRAGGSVVRRDDVPFSPGGFPHPMLLTGGRLAFTTLSHFYLMGDDLIETSQPLTEASFVVPGAAPGLVWLVGRGVAWVAPVDVETQTVGKRIDVTDAIRWPIVGLGDGLVVVPVDEDTYGSTAYWSPTGGLQRIDLPSSNQGGVGAASGNLAVVVFRGLIQILDFATGEYFTSFPIQLGEGLVSEVCLSPDQHYVAVAGSTGEAFVVDTNNGEFLQRLSGVHGTNTIGWASTDQLVYIIDIENETVIQTLDIATGQTHDIATLQSSRGWWLTASGTMC